MANLVSVYNTRNSKRIFEYEEGSYTHKQAVAGNGGWRLANPEQVKANSEKKKDVESVEDETPQNPIPSNEGENADGAEGEQAQGEQKVNEEIPQSPTPQPKKEGKPKAAGAKKNQTKEGK